MILHMGRQSVAKPLLRGHFHQAGFFMALGAGSMLVAAAPGPQERWVSLVYALSLAGLLGISTIYHRPNWKPAARAWLRRLDHSAIFILIAGTATPVCLLGMDETSGPRLLTLFWAAAILGTLKSLVWISAPKWLTAAACVAMGALAVPYLPEMAAGLGALNTSLILAGGSVYTAGAVIYALKRPNPLPKSFGYHEIFHLLVLLAALCHFLVIYRLIRS